MAAKATRRRMRGAIGLEALCMFTSRSVTGPLERFPAKVDPGSRKENASKQEARVPFRFNRNGKGSRSGNARMRPILQRLVCGGQNHAGIAAASTDRACGDLVRPIAVAQMAFHILPVGVRGNSASKSMLFGHLIGDRRSRQNSINSFSRSLPARAMSWRCTNRLDLFAHFLVRHAENGDVGHFGVGDQQVLGFLRVDVHPARDDHVGLAVE